MYLLDTDVVSELRKAKSGKANKQVVAWAASVEASDLYICVITLLELEIGVQQAERKDAAKGKLLRHWLNKQVRPVFEGRIIAVDEAVALKCASLHIPPHKRADRDTLIAATAEVHGLVMVTSNVVDFEGLCSQLINPWKHHAD
jgi:toxin FitB